MEVGQIHRFLAVPLGWGSQETGWSENCWNGFKSSVVKPLTRDGFKRFLRIRGEGFGILTFAGCVEKGPVQCQGGDMR